MRRDPPKLLKSGLRGKGLRKVIPDSGMMGPDWRRYRHGHHRPYKPFGAYCAPVHTRYPLIEKGKRRKPRVMSHKKLKCSSRIKSPPDPPKTRGPPLARPSFAERSWATMAVTSRRYQCLVRFAPY